MITISKAKVSEAQNIRRLEETIWKAKNITSKYDAASRVRFGYVFVAKDNKNIIGAIIASKTQKNEIYVEDFLVKKRYRGVGIGKKLYERLIRSVKKAPIIAFVSPKYKTSIHVHTELGFRIWKKIKDPYAQGKKEYRLLMRRD